MKKLTIFGVSNMIGDVFDCALACGYTDFQVVLNTNEVVRARTRSLVERISDLPDDVRVSVRRLEHYAPAADGAKHFLGTTAASRYRLVSQLREHFGIRLDCLVHPAAYVSPMTALADGVFVGAGSVIGPSAVLHECAYINRAASVGHDSVIGPYARVQPGANIGGHVRIGAFVTVGIGASVIEETWIGDAALIAGGAAVTNDVEPGQLVAGVPAVAKKAVAESATLPTWPQLESRLTLPVRGRRN
jgi:UDP-3-O-[3-hydroxymyristoyl] glucosamine N-acyltransferase